MSGGPGAESFALVWQGDPIGLDVKWRPCSLSFSPPMIPTPAPFFISVTLLPRLYLPVTKRAPVRQNDRTKT